MLAAMLAASTPACVAQTEEDTDGSSSSQDGSSGSPTSPTTSSPSGSGSAESSSGTTTSPSAESSTSTGGGEDEDTSGSSTGVTDTTVPVFLAAGDVGRTTYSCDLGETWAGNRSYDLEGDPLVCGEVAPVVCYDDASGCQLLDGETCETQASSCDCDHHPGAVQGVAYGDGWWVATWGWGPPGSVRRSQDGSTWETVIEGTTFGGLAYGNGTFMVGSRQPRVSSDAGATWVEAATAEFEGPGGDTVYNVRQLAFARAQGGHFVAIAADGDNQDVLLSSDEGGSWWRPDDRPAACLNQNRGILSSEDTIVLLGSDGEACTSGDGGQTWTTTPVGGGGSGVWDGERFWWWNGGTAYTSEDGLTWATQKIVDAPQLGAVAVDPESGTFVSVRGGWQNWYDRQEFYRSEDGLSWEILETSAFEPSHRIRHIAFADSESGVCAR